MRGAVTKRDVVLVGGGHAHVQVLRGWIMDPPAGVHVTVVVDRPVAVYSGMIPGLVAGHYAPHEAQIDVRPLAKRAGARFIVSRCLGIDADARRIHLDGRPPITYDVASLNLGSTVATAGTPGVTEYALPTRPIGTFAERMHALLAADVPPTRVVIVGGGAGGVEIAFAMRARLAHAGASGVQVTLIEAGPRLLPGHSPMVARRVHDACARHDIRVVVGRRVTRVNRDRVTLDDAEPLACDACVWVAGASAPMLLRTSGLPCDDRGFVWVDATLRVRGRDDLFAVGDCAVLEHWPEVPKAGVYAVRQGPTLARNLRARLAGHRLRRYRPQRDFLTLLNLSDGTAIGGKWKLCAHGAWVFRWKDRIDRRFVARFQVLDAEGGPASPFDRAVPPMPEDDMVCGGCAAKLGQSPLHRALGRLEPRVDPDVILGLDRPDDVAALQRASEVMAATVDHFPAFTDDPWLLGRIAAVNALSDLEAKAVAGRLALALVTVPNDEDAEELLFQVLAGARSIFDVSGVTLAGGHTTVGQGLAVGFALVGFAPSSAELLRQDGLRVGDALILTRGLGTGVLFRADMSGRAQGDWMQNAVHAMERGNAAAGTIAQAHGASAATDVTGFGLAGHLAHLVGPAGWAAEIDVAAVPALPGALTLLAAGVRSTFHEQNRDVLTTTRVPAELAHRPEIELLFDPQTAGGLLFALAPENSAAAVRHLHDVGETQAAVIGQIVAPLPDGALLFFR